MTRAHSYDFVKNYIENAGHTLLTTRGNYKNGTQILDIRCHDGHVYKRSFKAFKDKHQRCSDYSCIQKRIRETNLARYGTEIASQLPEVKARREATNLARRGVKNPLQCPKVQEKIRATNMTLRGVPYPTQSPEVKEKAKATNIAHRGVPYPAQSPEVQEKRKATCIVKYGAEHPMQNSEVAQRAFDNAYQYKSYTLPSGKVVQIQGYESLYLNHLFNVDKYPEDDVIFGSEKAKLPAIFYVFGGTTHKYDPDAYIIGHKLVVEVKSSWTYDGNGKDEEEYIKRKEQVHAKLDATFTAGFDTLLVVYDDKRNLVECEYKKHE